MNNNSHNPFAQLFNKQSSNQSTASNNVIHSNNHHQSPYHSSPQNYPPQQVFNQNPNLVNNNQYPAMNQPVQPQNSFSYNNYQQNPKK